MNPKASLLVGILCISFSPIFVKLAVAPALTSAFYRIFIAWVCLAPYCITKGKLKIGSREMMVAMLGGIVFGSDIAVWNLSLLKINATVSTLITNLAPVWVGLLGYILFKKLSGRLYWIGTFVAVAGMIVLVGFQNIIHLHFNIGILLALLASVLYAVYIIITRGILQKIDTITFMFYNMLAASVFLLVMCGVQHNGLTCFPVPTWLCFLGAGLLCQLLGWLTINHSLRFLEPTKVSIALLGQTVLAGIWATFFLNETLAVKEIAGSLIVLSGIAITFLKNNQSNKTVN